ncbi:hypothetical protein E8E12_006627 [Didymella heteroderae]|uniref:Uncharacterized protein n=1 Tax=Didymella heteroderae TaxID=1769908 RepID=A0A9P4WQ05_9PLEO|nr:hypothetical protein E8E12_006627 [Didymella heteroderae]
MSPEAITLHNQTASPLLRLPPEIRDRIYYFVLLYDGVVNIYPAANGVDFCTESHSIHGCADKWVTHQRPGDLRPDIPLRSTCRQISHEARNVYFAYNTFAFIHSIGFCGRDEFEDRHFKVSAMHEIKTVQMTVETSAVAHVGGRLHLDRLLSWRIDDLKDMRKLSKIHVRIHQSSYYFPPNLPLPASNIPLGLASPPMPFPKVPPNKEIVLKMIADEFETAGFRKATVCLLQERKQERDALKKVHHIRQWLDI